MISTDILNSFAGTKVLVTGGTGLIGRQVVQILVDAGALVTIVSLDSIVVHPQADHVYGDLTDLSFCLSITAGVEYLFHIAGIKGSIEVTKAKPASFFVPLLMMNTNVLEAARRNGVKKVVYTSSIGAYGSAEVFIEKDDLDEAAPMDAFPGWAKRMAELQIKAYQIQYGDTSFAVVRPCNVYGPGDNFDPNNAMVVPSLMARVSRGEDPLVVWGDGSAIRDFAYSEDVAKGVVLALWHGTNGRYVNLGSGHGVTIRELVATMSEIVGCRYEFDPTKPAGFPQRVMDISLARKALRYAPEVSLREGLRRTWEWFLLHEQEYLRRQNYFAEEDRR